MRVFLTLIAAGLAAALARENARAGEASLEDVFDYLDTQPQPRLLPGFGDNGVLEISTSSHATQRYFTNAMDLLHGFNPFQALRAMYYAHRQDPDSMMPMWGIHKCLQWNGGYAGASDEALQRAWDLREGASAHEQMWLDVEYHSADVESFNASMAAIVSAYPDDVTARLLWAWGLVDRTVTVFGAPVGAFRQQAQDALWELTAELPSNAAAMHYLIHAYEDTLEPGRVLEAIQGLPAAAPGGGHYTHMPGHIYFLLGNYSAGSEVFAHSADVDRAFMEENAVVPLNHWELLHNLAYEACLLAEAGRVHEALQLSLELQQWRPELEQAEAQPLEFSPQASRALARYFFQILPQLGFLHWRTEDWDACEESLAPMNAGLELRMAGTPSAFMPDFYAALGAYCAGMGAATRGDVDRAEAQQALLAAQILKVNASFSGGGTYDYSVMTRAEFALGVNQAELDAMVAVARGETAQGLEMLAAAAGLEAQVPYNEPTAYPRPVLQSVAAVQLQLGQYDAVVQACETILANPLHAGSGYALFRAGLASELKGDAEAATAYYSRMVYGPWAGADADLPQMRHARAFLRARA